MRRFFTERNLVVVLFFVALGFFVLAQKDAGKIEMKYMGPGSDVSTLPLASPVSAEIKISPVKKLPVPVIADIAR